MSTKLTNIAIIGTGFVADYYMVTLQNHPNLKLKEVWDVDPKRLKQFCDFYEVDSYSSFENLLSDSEVDIVVNLTTPQNHYETNFAALEAEKHVYCEKPLAMTVDEAINLSKLAIEKKRLLCSAPANALSDAFQQVSGLIQDRKIGAPKLVYVQLEDGPVFRSNWQTWKSRSGAPWPGVHEFETGCTIEHAGYSVSWLLALFGPVRHVSAFSTVAFPDKGPGTKNLNLAPDYSVGTLSFDNGVVARVTCGLSAPRDRSMTVVGEEGTLTVRDLWDNSSDLLVSHYNKRGIRQKILERIETKLGKTLPVNAGLGSKFKYPKNKSLSLPGYPSQIDFTRGVATQAKALTEDVVPFFSGDVATHMTEITLALHGGEADYKPVTDFDFAERCKAAGMG